MIDSNYSSMPEPGQPESGDVEQIMKWEVWARVELDKLRDPAALQAEMVSVGWDPPTAAELVARIRQSRVLDYQDAATEREEWRRASSKHRRMMIVGGLACTAGILVTVRTYTAASSTSGPFLIAWGMVVFGAVRFVHGLLGYIRPIPTRLDGHHVPGRRIGAFTPGAARTRFSRYQ